MAWWVWLLVGLVLNIVAYLLMPRPKAEKPPAVQDIEGPTSEAGRPIPVVFGTITVKGLNVLHWSDKGYKEYEVSV